MAENSMVNEIQHLLDDAYILRINNIRKSIGLAGKALTLSRTLQNISLTAQSLSRLSLFTMISGDYKESMDYGEEAISLFNELKDEAGIADAKYNIAGIFYKTDNSHMGLVYLIDCLKTYRQRNDWPNVSRCEKSLGTIYEYFGDQKNAIKAYRNALDAGILAGDINLESNVYNPLSGIYLKQGLIQQAMEMVEKAITIKKDTGDLRGLAFAVYGRAKVFAKLNLYKEAERDYIEAMGIHSDMSEQLGLAMVYRKLGILYFKMNQNEKAEDILLKGIQFTTEHNILILKFKCHYVLYEVYRKGGQTEKALYFLEEYLKQKEAVINTQTLTVIENYELITQMETLEKEAALEKEKAEITTRMVRAEQASGVKQESLSAISHEIRTPLNALITIAGMLTEKTDKERDELTESLKCSANNLLYIVNNLLDFTQLDSNKLKLEISPANLREVLLKVANTYRLTAKNKGLDFEVSFDILKDEMYEMDEARIGQIISNILNNAVKYTAEGYVKFEINFLNRTENLDKIRFSIKDSGDGIPKEYQESIFDSFTLKKNHTTRKEGGAGLGLAIVKKLLSLHGSKISLESENNEGSTFYFDLELKRIVSKINTSSPQENLLKGCRVLLAEDNPMNAFVATKVLSNWGISVLHAKNGMEATEMAATQEFDFILMDIHMPGMNGYEATEYIRTNDNPNRSKPIFALTADITAIQEERYVPYFNGFLWKPLEVRKLLDALTSCINTDALPIKISA